jgi:hypothetical protein
MRGLQMGQGPGGDFQRLPIEFFNEMCLFGRLATLWAQRIRRTCLGHQNKSWIVRFTVWMHPQLLAETFSSRQSLALASSCSTPAPL